jgi:hypothetical protein
MDDISDLDTILLDGVDSFPATCALKCEKVLSRCGFISPPCANVKLSTAVVWRLLCLRDA